MHIWKDQLTIRRTTGESSPWMIECSAVSWFLLCRRLKPTPGGPQECNQWFFNINYVLHRLGPLRRRSAGLLHVSFLQRLQRYNEQAEKITVVGTSPTPPSPTYTHPYRWASIMCDQTGRLFGFVCTRTTIPMIPPCCFHSYCCLFVLGLASD